jgi:hypothetical protein
MRAERATEKRFWFFGAFGFANAIARRYNARNGRALLRRLSEHFRLSKKKSRRAARTTRRLFDFCFIYATATESRGNNECL